ncbi:MAG: DUF2975 domain-containing protein [Alphaproteobacteria bacterium]|nr:DUF2975 domain-containing protein [Alphaproteobacteria bacterium]
MSNLVRIQRISRVMRICCTIIAFAIPPVLATMWATFSVWAPTHPELAHIRPLPDPMPPASLMLGFAISLIPGSISIYAFWRLRTLFGLYEQGQIFTADCIRSLRGFAIAIILFAVAKPFANALLSMALTFSNPPGQKMLSISVGSSDFTTAFIGCVFLIIGWTMDEGRELAEDQAQIV